jgi:uncharacterized membrane protein
MFLSSGGSSNEIGQGLVLRPFSTLYGQQSLILQSSTLIERNDALKMFITNLELKRKNKELRMKREAKKAVSDTTSNKITERKAVPTTTCTYVQEYMPPYR